MEIDWREALLWFMIGFAIGLLISALSCRR